MNGNLTNISPAPLSPMPAQAKGWEAAVCMHGVEALAQSSNNIEVLPMLLQSLISTHPEAFGSINNSPAIAPAAAFMFANPSLNPLTRKLLLSGAAIGLFTDTWKDKTVANEGTLTAPDTKYVVHPDQPLNTRVSEQPQLVGASLMLTVDGIPYVLTLPWEAVDAVERKSLPVNTLINAIIERHSASFGLVSSSMDQKEAASHAQQIRFS